MLKSVAKVGRNMFTRVESVQKLCKCSQGRAERAHKGRKRSQMLKMFTNAGKCCEGWTEHVHKDGKCSQMLKSIQK